jgi:hypothetical protein
VERIRQQSAGSYSLTVATTDPSTGEPVTAGGEPAVTITDGGGAQVFAGPAIASEGALSCEVPVASLPLLDTYSCQWTGQVGGSEALWLSRVEVCGGYLFEIAEWRAYEPAFADPVKFPEAALRAARLAAEQRFERAARVAFVPRCFRWAGWARGYPVPIGYGIGYDAGVQRIDTRINAIRCLRSIAVNGTPLSADELAALAVFEWGAIDKGPGDYWTNAEHIQVCLEAGYDFAPEPVAVAAMILGRDYAMRSNLSPRATVESTDVGFFRLSVAGPGRPTGIPEVDAAVAEFGRRRGHV